MYHAQDTIIRQYYCQPVPDVEAVLNAGAKKEALYLERFGRPLFPMDRMRRETFNMEKQQPSAHHDSLQKYL